METLTYYIEGLFLDSKPELGSSEYQKLEKITIKSISYSDLIVSGSLLKEVVFEDVIFENCTFFGSQLVNCLFINCLFINCKFQFTKFSDCNFEQTSWENCKWGLSALKQSELISGEAKGTVSFQSILHHWGEETKATLAEFLTLSA